jgi:hypothetical protein
VHTLGGGTWGKLVNGSLGRNSSGPYNVASLWLNYQSRVAKVLTGLYPDELEKRLTKPQYAAVMQRVRLKMEHAVTNKQRRESTSCSTCASPGCERVARTALIYSLVPAKRLLCLCPSLSVQLAPWPRAH